MQVKCKPPFPELEIVHFFLQRCIPAFHKGIRMQVKCKPPFPELEFVHFFLQRCIPAFHKGISI